MVIFLQRTFISLVNAHVGRTQVAQADVKNTPLSKALCKPVVMQIGNLSIQYRHLKHGVNYASNKQVLRYFDRNVL